MLVALAIGFPIGIFAALIGAHGVRLRPALRTGWTVRFPHFWLGIMLILVLGESRWRRPVLRAATTRSIGRNPAVRC